MKTAITFVIAIVVFVFHYWACRRSPKYWYAGGIIPLLWFGALAVLFWKGMIHWAEDWRVLLFPTLIFLLMWAEGHQAAKKKELEKMRAQDIP